MTPREDRTPDRRGRYEKIFAEEEVQARHERNKTLLPSARAIVWTTLALVVFVLPFWGR